MTIVLASAFCLSAFLAGCAPKEEAGDNTPIAGAKKGDDTEAAGGGGQQATQAAVTND
jgi:Spy/CpxP family protein refolding chaperone